MENQEIIERVLIEMNKISNGNYHLTDIIRKLRGNYEYSDIIEEMLENGYVRPVEKGIYRITNAGKQVALKSSFL
jgi:predicted transcriptional regulator